MNKGSIRSAVLRVIGGRDPGALARVRRLCVRCFVRRTRGAVGLLAIGVVTAVVKRCRGDVTLCSSDGSGITLCSVGGCASLGGGGVPATKESSCRVSACKVDKVR